MKYEDNWLKRQKAHGWSCQYTVVEKYKTELSVAIYKYVLENADLLFHSWTYLSGKLNL